MRRNSIRFEHPSEVVAFRDWVTANPDGFCIERCDRRRHPVLHRSSCCHLGVSGFEWAPLPVECFANFEELADEYGEYDWDEEGFQSWYANFEREGDANEYFDQIDSCDLCHPTR